MLQERFNTIVRGLFPDGGKVLLAVSGGVDSVVMAELFSSCCLPFDVAHCNFQLRGKESDTDEAFVRRWCRDRGVSFHGITFDTKACAKERGISVEMTARELRYDWFAALAKAGGFTAVAVAHNANDNAETFVLNLLRGSGLKGLCGMKEDGYLPLPKSELRLIRPLLRFSRREIEDFAVSRDLKWRVDSSNASSEYKRNRVRNEIFPLFAKINPSFLKTFSSEMSHFTQALGVLDDHFAEVSKRVVCRESGTHLPGDIQDGETVAVDVSALRAEKHLDWIIYRLLGPFGFTPTVMQSLSALLCGDEPISGRRFFSEGYELSLSSSRLEIFPIERKHSVPCSLVVNAAGVYELNGRTFEVSLKPMQPDFPLKRPEGSLVMDAARLPFPFALRSWEEGDWFVPFGMRGRKKLSDYFTDLKMGPKGKERAVVAEMAGSHVAAVLCLRIDDGLRVGPLTSQLLSITEI